MRKLSIVMVLALCASSAFAQRVTTKDGRQILPEAGDWSIAIDANPFLNYFGNFIGGVDANTAPSWSYLTNNQTITGRYFVTDDMAYRGSLRLGFTSSSTTVMVRDRSVAAAPSYPELPEMVENKASSGSTNIALSGGMEWRKGDGRLQGIYGGELGIGLTSSSTSYEYGNDLDPTGTNPVFVDADDDFGTGNITNDTYGNTARVLEDKSGASFGIGVRGFVGAEYFLLPKLSLGGEFGWGLVFSTSGSSTTTLESTDGSIVGEQELEGSKSSGFGIDTDNVNSIFGPIGALRVAFYF